MNILAWFILIFWSVRIPISVWICNKTEIIMIFARFHLAIFATGLLMCAMSLGFSISFGESPVSPSDFTSAELNLINDIYLWLIFEGIILVNIAIDVILYYRLRNNTTNVQNSTQNTTILETCDQECCINCVVRVGLCVGCIFLHSCCMCIK